jgi:hypothetical protein
VQKFAFSPPMCNIVFVIVVCITKRRRLRNDPHNFSTLNINIWGHQVYYCLIWSKSFITLPVRKEKNTVRRW